MVGWGAFPAITGGPAASKVPALIPTTAGALAGKTIATPSAGYYHISILCTDGTVAGWGNNGNGELGNGATNSMPVATPVQASTSRLTSGERFIATSAATAEGRTDLFTALPLGNNARLANLAVNGGVLLPEFSPANTAYAVAVPHGTASLTLTPVTADPFAKISVNGVPVTSGSATAAIPLTPGGTTITLEVVAQNGADSVSYTLMVRDDSRLAALGLETGILAPAFRPWVTQYAVYVAAGTATLRLTPVTGDPSAAVTVNGAAVAAGTPSDPIALAVGSTPVTVAVTALDGSSTIYNLSVVRPGPLAFTFASATATALTTPAYDATGNTFNLALGLAPPTGTDLVVINNTGPGQIAGRFASLAQGQAVALVYNNATYKFVANYYGGTGNDLVLVWAANRVCGWGRNDAGQLGTGSTSTSSNIPVLAIPGALAGKTVVAVAAGISHSLALCADGSLAAWGSNNYRQLGTGGTVSVTVPTAVPAVGALAGKFVVAIAASGDHSLALCADGTVAAWGNNGYGQLGNGTQGDLQAVPVAVLTDGALAGKVVTAIAASHDHSLALCQDGTVVSWGRNLYGKLGDGTNTTRSAPVAVVTSTGLAGRTVTAIAGGRSFSLALCSDGAMFSWGGNFSGELGIGRPDPYVPQVYASTTPVKVLATGVLAGKTVVAIGTASDGAAAVLADGRIATWGFPLGTGTTGVSVEPVLANSTSGVLGGKAPISACGGEGFMVAFAKGNACAWGYNGGKLGDGTTTSNYQPVAVSTSSLGTGYRLVGVGTGSGAYHTLGIAAVPLSTNSALSALVSNVGTLAPAFAAGTLAYTLTAPGATGSITLTATAADADASVRVNGSPVPSGTPSQAIPLVAGTNLIQVVVTAPSGATRTYSLAVNRQPVFAGYAAATPYQTAASIALAKLLAKAADADGETLTLTAAGTSANGGTAVLQSGAVRYTPPAGFSGTDAFPVTIRDARGAVTTGTVTMAVGPGPTAGGVGANPPTITPLPGGKIGIAFQGIIGRSYLVQRSIGGLDNWVTLAALVADAGGKVS